MNKRMYILINEDIKISKGKLAGQVGHAVMSYLYHGYIKQVAEPDKAEEMNTYMQVGQAKILLKCPQWRLEELEEQGNRSIRDKGLTELAPNTLTCINFGLWKKEEVPEWVTELKLYN